MIVKNESKKLSRNRNRRIGRKNKLNDDVKLLLKKIKTKKKKKFGIFDKINELEILLVRSKYANKPDKLGNALKEVNKIEVIDKNIHVIKHEVLLDYTGEFEMVGNLKVGHHIRDTRVRFRNINDYEAYIKQIDQDYESDDAIFNGYIYKLDTPEFNEVNRNQNRNGCDFKHEIFEYRGNNCYIPTKGYCFIKCV